MSLTRLQAFALSPDARRPLTLSSFTQDFLPPIILYYVTAILVILPRTLPIRLTLFPITMLATFRAATQLDLSMGWDHDRESLLYWNQGLILAMCNLGMRVCIWTFQQKPLRRHATKDQPQTIKRVLIDAWDLFCSLRGVGWNWSEGLQLPPETRPLQPASAFASRTAFAFVKHIVAFDFIHYALQSFDFAAIGSPQGGTIYDAALPPHYRYLRSTAIAFLGGLAIFNGIQVLYLLLTLIGVVLLRQRPSDWPPLFMSPYKSTSLTRLWARDWHQLFRDNFYSFGGRPFATITGTGRVGVVLGSFLVSGLLHDFALWGMGRGTDFKRVAGFFLMMGVGIIFEGIWKRNITGKKVGGFLGWVWTMLWVLGWGNGLLEAWSVRGLIGSQFAPDSIRPSVFLVGKLRTIFNY